MNGYDDFAEHYYGQLFDEAMTGKTYFKDDNNDEDEPEDYLETILDDEEEEHEKDFGFGRSGYGE